MLRRFTVALIASATLATGIALTPTEAFAWGWGRIYDVGYCGRPCRRPYYAYYGWGWQPMPITVAFRGSPHVGECSPFAGEEPAAEYGEVERWRRRWAAKGTSVILVLKPVQVYRVQSWQTPRHSNDGTWFRRRQSR